MEKEVKTETLGTFDVGLVAGGAINERLNRAVKRITDNIMDPNTEPGVKRELGFKVVFVPSKGSRRQVTAMLTVTCKLAPEQANVTQFRVAVDAGGEQTLVEDPDASDDPRQAKLPIEPERPGATAEVVGFNRERNLRAVEEAQA